MLSESEKHLLLRVARQSIDAAIHGSTPEPITGIPSSLMEHCGAFVTLHSRGDLRGCIGYIEGFLPLIETVREVAIKAALEDPRFMPVREDELDEIEIEISALSPLRHINDVAEIEVGKHGIVIQHGRSRGLLLPQVATEYNWDRETFLRQTCGKAGLKADQWKDPQTKISVFSAEIFHEEK